MAGWLIEREFFGLTAKSAHVGNILLHVFNAVLVFFLLRKIGDMLARSRQIPPLVLSGGASAGALIWAVHPLRVEVVAWASGRMYCQAAFFLLIALITYLRACGAEIRPGSARWVARRLRAGFWCVVIDVPDWNHAAAAAARTRWMGAGAFSERRCSL